MIGTANGGHVFPGATVPYGMAKAVADTNSRGENAGGFVSDDNAVLGFSQLHDSGTGGSASLGNFPLFMHAKCPEDDVTQCGFSAKARQTKRVPGSVRASPGYFSVTLNNSVRAEMTTTAHTVLYRFSFGGKAAEAKAEEAEKMHPVLLLDLQDLGNTRRSGSIQVDATTGRMTGSGVFRPSFGRGSYSAYFCADVQGAQILKTGTFQGTGKNSVVEERKVLDQAMSGVAGAWIQFGDGGDERDGIFVRVGLSFVSSQQACDNAERELPGGGEAWWSLDETVRTAQDAWRARLSTVAVDATGVSTEMQTMFWSGLYRSMLSPQNYTGENSQWNSTEPYYDSFYCIWDSFRAQHPLLTIVDPSAQTEMLRALVDIYRFEGKLPDCRMSFCKGFTQGGSNADVVLADALVKGLTDDVDWYTAWLAVVSDAEEEPANWGVEGRGNLERYHALGYVPWDDADVVGYGPRSRSVSRTVEYAYDDFAISLMAREMARLAGGDPKALPRGVKEVAAMVDLAQAAEKYHQRGANWRRLWNAEQDDSSQSRISQDRSQEGSPTVHSPYKGFLQPRGVDGSWKVQAARRCSPVFDQHSCYYDTKHETYEGSPWLYSFYAPHDMQTLVHRMMGGRDAFVRRLDYFHSSGLRDLGNEQAFLPMFQYHYAGRPSRSSDGVRRVLGLFGPDEKNASLFDTSVTGLPGNDDGAMGAFVVLCMLGLFPVAGQDVYLLTPPLFREATIHTSTDRKNHVDATVRVRNFDPTFHERPYVQRVLLNGKPYRRSWITHDFFRRGGLLEYEMGPEESDWGTAEEDLPPSYY